MSKKTTVIVLVLVALVVLVLGIWFLFFTDPTIQNLTPNGDNPFGTYNGSSSTTPVRPTTQTGSTAQAGDYINNPTSPLLRISNVPISGAEVFDRKITTIISSSTSTSTPSKATTTTASIVRYIERATGHTSEYNRTTKLLTTSSNTTIPGIYKAFWSGNTVIAQFLGQDKETVKSFVGNLPATTSPTTQLIGGFLSDDVVSLAISPKGNKLFTITYGQDTVGSISNLDGSKRTTILNFPFNEWIAQWPNENVLTLNTKASFSAPGYLYYLTTGGTMTKTLGNIAGLTTLTSPDLNQIIYSGSNTGGFSTGIYDVKKGTTLAFTNTPTLPEKCVWSKLNKNIAYCAIPSEIPTGNYPDDWYKGNVSFVDNIYKVDLGLPAVQLLFKLPKDQRIDATDLFLDAKEENLYFTNKTDYYLWGLTIKGLIAIGL